MLSDTVKLRDVKSDTEQQLVLDDEVAERLMKSVNDQEALSEVLILIFNQPIDKFDSYNAATRHRAAL